MPEESSAEIASEAALADHVRAERVRFVFIQAPLPMFFSPLSAALLSFAIWQWVPHTRLLVWTALLTVIAIGRVALVYSFPRNAPTVQQVRRWEKIFVASIVVVDLTWGFGALTLLTELPAERALVFSFLMLMAGGHAASYAAHPRTVLLGVLALTVPVTVLFAFQPDAFHRAMAIAAVLYLLATFRSIHTLGYFFGRTHRLAHELKQEKDRAELLARTDVLTQLNNRRAFYDLGEAALNHATRYVHPFSVMMIDIDHFKEVNVRFGHAGGDAALRFVASIIRGRLRQTDITGRVGGEEFAMILPETSIDAAQAIAESLRASVESQQVDWHGAAIRLTASVGLA